MFGREAWVEEFRALVEELLGEGGGRGGMAWRGGGGWLRLVQQNTACPLNTIPTLGDQVDAMDILAILGLMGSGCVETGKILGSFAGVWGAVLGCIIGAEAGLLMGLFVGHFAWRDRLEEASIAWCERNRSVCQGVEAYHAFCDEVINPQ